MRIVLRDSKNNENMNRKKRINLKGLKRIDFKKCRFKILLIF